MFEGIWFGLSLISLCDFTSPSSCSLFFFLFISVNFPSVKEMRESYIYYVIILIILTARPDRALVRPAQRRLAVYCAVLRLSRH